MARLALSSRAEMVLCAKALSSWSEFNLVVSSSPPALVGKGERRGLFPISSGLFVVLVDPQRLRLWCSKPTQLISSTTPIIIVLLFLGDIKLFLVPA